MRNNNNHNNNNNEMTTLAFPPKWDFEYAAIRAFCASHLLLWRVLLLWCRVLLWWW